MKSIVVHQPYCGTLAHAPLSLCALCGMMHMHTVTYHTTTTILTMLLFLPDCCSIAVAVSTTSTACTSLSPFFHMTTTPTRSSNKNCCYICSRICAKTLPFYTHTQAHLLSLLQPPLQYSELSDCCCIL
jgi:hypothetical protein